MDTSHMKVKSTSSSSAECSDMVLRTTTTTRLIFRPMLVDNRHDPAAAVKGTFMYQRKGPNEQWTDFDTIPFSSLKKGEGYRLEVKSGELLPLVQQLNGLYRLHAEQGVPQGEVQFVQIADSLQGLSSMSHADLATFLDAHSAVGEDVLRRLLAWASAAKDFGRLVELLERLEQGELRALRVGSGINSLANALQYWRDRFGEKDEEFWQKALADHSFVLEQVYSWPVTVVKDKAYVGGKSVMNTGGGVVDFLVKNGLTQNAALIEIKTPSTSVLGQSYRAGVWTPSTELAGAIVQVLSYRDRLLKEYHHLSGDQGQLFEAFEPSCAVIIGSAKNLGDEERRSFELFRSQIRDVRIVTFDELFEKTERAIGVMQASVETVEAERSDDSPF